MLLLGLFATPASVAVPVAAGADMGVSVTGDPDPVSAGNDLAYTITVTNNGPNAADASLADTLPSGTTFNSLDVPTGWNCTTPAVGAGGSISCATASIASGDSATFTLSVHVASSVADGGSLSDTATVSTDASDSNSGNNSATATTTIENNAAVGITKTASADTVLPGETLTYTIDVTNAGPSDAANVTWQDALPGDVTFVSENQSSGPTFTCTRPSVGSGGTVSCAVASLPAGSTAEFTLTVAVSPTPSGGSISNTATVSSDTQDFSETPNNSSTATTAIQSAADLSVTKTASPTVSAGNTLTYTITVTNNGVGPVGDVVLTDDVPTGTSFSGISGGPEPCSTPDPGAGGTIECTIPSLAGGGSVTYTLKVAVLTTDDNGSTITNTATVDSSSNTDPDTSNDSATATTTVQANADLVATSSDSPDPVLAGNQLTYTIDLNDNGPDSAHGVTLADTLPPGTTFVSLSAPGDFNCSTPTVGASGTVSCSGGTIDLGGATVTLVVRVNPDVAPGAMLSNTATASSTTPDPNPGDESTTATTTVNTQADVSVLKTGPDSVPAGGDVTYSIELDNNGPSDAADATLSDALPAGTTFKSISAPTGFNCTDPGVGNTGTVTCTAASLAADAKDTFTLVVGTTAPAESFISNTATESSTTPDPSAQNSSSTATTQVQKSVDLAVTKSDSPDPVTAGTNLTYTLGVTNDGPSDATNVSLTDDVPSGTTFVSISAPPGWNCMAPSAGGTGTVSCSDATMANGASASFTLVVHVDPSTVNGSMLSNTATASSDQSDPDTGNDSATSTTTVQTSADVAASVSDSPDPVTAGKDLTYKLGAANNGPSDATNVALTDDLPAGTTFVSLAAPAGFSCTTPSVGAGGSVECTASSLASGASRTFTLVVHVTSSQPDGSTLSNTGKVTRDDADPNPGNDTAFSGTSVVTSADLSTSVSDSPDPVDAGNVVAYHLHIHDDGPSDAASPRLSVTIPSGTTLVGAAQTGGSAFHCTSDGTTVTCAADSLASGGSAAIDMDVKTGRSQRGTISVHPTASSSTSDPNPSNDGSSETTTITPAPTSVTIGRTVTKRRSGSITVAIGCHGVPGDVCPVAVTVTFNSPHSDLAPITGTKTIKTGRRSTVWVIGPPSERRRIKRIHTLPVTVDVTNDTGSGATRDATIVGTH